MFWYTVLFITEIPRRYTASFSCKNVRKQLIVCIFLAGMDRRWNTVSSSTATQITATQSFSAFTIIHFPMPSCAWTAVRSRSGTPTLRNLPKRRADWGSKHLLNKLPKKCPPPLPPLICDSCQHTWWGCCVCSCLGELPDVERRGMILIKDMISVS